MSKIYHFCKTFYFLLRKFSPGLGLCSLVCTQRFNHTMSVCLSHSDRALLYSPDWPGTCNLSSWPQIHRNPLLLPPSRVLEWRVCANTSSHAILLSWIFVSQNLSIALKTENKISFYPVTRTKGNSGCLLIENARNSQHQTNTGWESGSPLHFLAWGGNQEIRGSREYRQQWDEAGEMALWSLWASTCLGPMAVWGFPPFQGGLTLMSMVGGILGHWVAKSTE